MDKRRKPAIREPRPHLTMEEMRSYLTSLREIESVTGIRQDDYRYPRSIGQGIHHQSR